MKNTTFKKKALISSIAMLLVALVALGSATFAWFAANPDASANGLKMKTTASSGLVIRTDSFGTWDHSATLYTGQSTPAFDLQPGSQDQETPTTFRSIEALNAASYAMNTSKTVSTLTVGGFSQRTEEGGTALPGQVYAEKVYFRLSDGSAATGTEVVQLQGVTITQSNGSPSLYNGIRVSVTDKAGALIGTWAPSIAGQNGYLKGDKSTDDFSPALAAASTSLTTNCNVSSMSASATDFSNFVTVYVWLDGQDTAVYSDNVGTVNAEEIISGITLAFKLV